MHQTVHNLTGRMQDQARPNQTGSGQAIEHAFDETSRPVSANFSAKPDSTLLRNASRAGAVVGVDTIGPTGPIISRASSPARYPLVGRQFECASMTQAQATCRRLDCARLLGSSLNTEYSHTQWPAVEPSGSTISPLEAGWPSGGPSSERTARLKRAIPARLQACHIVGPSGPTTCRAFRLDYKSGLQAGL